MCINAKLLHKFATIFVIVLLFIMGCDLISNKEKPPNILFILVDDQRNNTLGCYGHPIVKTPNIDRLAAQGVRFDNMFVTTSICMASRASIFTSMMTRTHGAPSWQVPMRAKPAKTAYPVLLGQAGYRIGFVGEFGFQLSGGPPLVEWFDYQEHLDRNPYFKKQADGSERHVSEIAGDHAVQFLKSQPENQPFCLSVSFNAAHAEDGDKRPGIGHFPWPKAVDGLYEDLDIPLPRLSDPAIFESQPDFLKQSLNRKRYFWRWDTPEKYQINMRAYFRMISGVDLVIGRILKVLKEQDFAKNTIVIYSADNGYYMGDRGFAGKWSHYEESLRVPLIIYDPRLPQEERGKTIDQMALNIDIPVTMLDWAGVPIPEVYQGMSLKQIVNGRAQGDWRTDFFCEHLAPHPGLPKWEGVRGERYVYARYFEQDPIYEFLHDLISDPDELKNFATDPAYSKVRTEMQKRCDELRNQYLVSEDEVGESGCK